MPHCWWSYGMACLLPSPQCLSCHYSWTMLNVKWGDECEDANTFFCPINVSSILSTTISPYMGHPLLVPCTDQLAINSTHYFTSVLTSMHQLSTLNTLRLFCPEAPSQFYALNISRMVLCLCKKPKVLSFSKSREEREVSILQ
jgi:hypothetical protein